MLVKGTKKLIGWFISPGKWMGWGTIKQQTSLIKKTGKPLFSVQKATFSETFEESVKRLGLSEKALHERMNFYFRCSLFCFLLSLGLFFYTLYLVLYGTFFNATLGFSLVGLGLTFTFRYHFWYSQIKKRQLGLTFSQWWHLLINRK